MQNHLEISSKTEFWTRNVRNLAKSRDLVMSGLAKTCAGGQVLTANQRKYFFSDFIKSLVLPNKFIIFYKIIGVTKQIYYFLYIFKVQVIRIVTM